MSIERRLLGIPARMLGALACAVTLCLGVPACISPDLEPPGGASSGGLPGTPSVAARSAADVPKTAGAATAGAAAAANPGPAAAGAPSTGLSAAGRGAAAAAGAAAPTQAGQPTTTPPPGGAAGASAEDEADRDADAGVATP